MIAQSTIEEIKNRTDIVELIGSYLSLKRAGSAFRALCPFHNEKTPSFNVNPARQIFHCFGCGKGGSVFQFVMDYEGVDFVSAVKILAERAGVELEEDAGSSVRRDERQRLFQLNEQATTLFQRLLREHPEARMARDYLRARQLDDALVSRFQMGFAPDQWDTIEQWGRQERIDPSHLEEAGFLVKKEQEAGKAHYYDRFRNRLMIPIRDELGRAIGFTGRLLAKDDRSAKYVNSPETPVFQKNRVLFALDLARRALVDQRVAILCEGQIDAIRCHQAGFINTVASQGTALTENHVRMIKRYCDEVILVLDPDAAGQKAALRAYELFLSAEVGVRVARLPGGEDPDTLIAGKGAAAFQSVLDEAVSGLTFMIDLLKSQDDIEADAGMTRILRRVLAAVQYSPSPVLREKLLDEASAQLGVDRYALHADFARLKPLRQEGPAAARKPPSGEHHPVAEASAPKAQAYPPHELALVEILLPGSPEACALVHDCLPLHDITDPACREVIRQCLEQVDSGMPPNIRVSEDSPPELERLTARLLAHPFRLRSEDYDAVKAVQDVLLAIFRKKLESRKREVKRQLASAKGGDYDHLLEQHNHLSEDLLHLRKGWAHAQSVLQC